jgi:hypothetical protein
MLVRLSDLIAPSWQHQLAGRWRAMRPLSLLTFAELEGYDIGMASLSSGEAEAWIKLYAYLSGLDPHSDLTALMRELVEDPLGFKVFQEIMKRAFEGSADGEGPTVVRRRTIVDSREAAKSEGRHEIDMSFLVTLARMSGIPLSDLLRMTFRGIHAVQASLEELPPMMGGLGLPGKP